MLTREVKIRRNRKLDRILNSHLWHLTGVYNWAIKQIEAELKAHSKQMGPLPEQFEYALAFNEKKNKVRLKVIGINTGEYGLYSKLSGNAKRANHPISNEAILSMAYQARTAWDRCLKGIGGKPRLKSNRNRLNGFSFYGDCKVDLQAGVATLPKIGKVKFKKFDLGEHLQGKKIQAHVTVKRRADGWYLLFRVDAEHEQMLLNSEEQVGIDPGMKSLVSLSNGKKIEVSLHRRKAADQMARVQRGVSKNRELAKRLRGIRVESQENKIRKQYHPESKIARKHLKLARQTKDFNHRLSHDLVRDYQSLFWSDDNFKAQQRIFGKGILSNSPGQLRDMISYKSSACGREYLAVSNQHSTMTCSACRSLTGPQGRSGLKVRFWVCAHCGVSHDRDTNAAMNTLRVGLEHSLELKGSVGKPKKPPEKPKQPPMELLKAPLDGAPVDLY